MTGLKQIWQEALSKYEAYTKEENVIYHPESDNIKFDTPPLCIRSLLESGVYELGTKNAIQYRLAAYFKSQNLSQPVAIRLLNNWAENITPDKTHEILSNGQVDLKTIQQQNSFICNTVYSSSQYGFSCAGIKQIPGVKCDTDCEQRVTLTRVTTLFEASKAEFRYKRIAVDVEVVGRRDVVRIIPKEVKAQCNASIDSAKCVGCSLYHSASGVTFNVTAGSPGIINFVEPSNMPLSARIGKIVGMSRRECNNWSWSITEQNCETIFIAPRLTNEAIGEDRYTRQAVYHIGHGIETAQTYRLSGYSHVSDKDGDVIFVFDKIDELADSLTEFEWNDQKAKDSKVFQLGKGQSIKDKLSDISFELNQNVVRLWGRENMLKLVDLTFHSVRRFYFQDRLIKGWLDVLIIGDSGQGKSEAIDRFMQYYQAGYLTSAESMTRAGLLYGVDVKGEGPPTLMWGALPRHSGRLVVIDEAKKIIESGDFGLLTRARSSGIVSVDTIVGGRATCETRLITMSNAADRRKMGAFMFPVESIPNLIPAYEDIRRFDIVMGVMSNEIPDEAIHRDVLNVDKIETKYTSEKCSNLLYYIWNLTPDKIIYDHLVQKRTLSLSLQMCKEYCSDIPIVEPADQRLKLARLAVAIAARIYNVNNNGDLVITNECVEEAYNFMNELYSSPALDYLGYSMANAKMVVSDKVIEELISSFKTHMSFGYYWKSIGLYLTHNIYVKKGVFAAAVGLDNSSSATCLNWMGANMLAKNIKSDVWVLTANGVKFIKTIMPVLEDISYKKASDVGDIVDGEF